MTFDITKKQLTGIYVSKPHEAHNNELFVLFEFADAYLFFDGFSFSMICNKHSVSLDDYNLIDHSGLGDNLKIAKAFVLESYWCYVMFNNGEAFHVYQTFDGSTWWQEYELILKSDTARYNNFIESINDDEVDEIDLLNLELVYKNIKNNSAN